MVFESWTFLLKSPHFYECCRLNFVRKNRLASFIFSSPDDLNQIILPQGDVIC